MELFFKTRYLLEIKCADTIYFLTRLTEEGVTAQNILPVDPLTIRIEVFGNNLLSTKALASRMGAEVQVIRAWGIKATLGALKKRLVLVCGIAAIVLLTLYIPSRVLFVSIEGNERIDEAYILEQAEGVGIFFGASRRDVRSEKMKNALLHAIPELKWAGINTYGCRAEIHVIERDVGESTPSAAQLGQGIYAVRDGIISSITVTKGSALCKPGQAIRAGQLLVSGYTDSGLITRAEHAEGEVRGVTQRRIDALSPNIVTNRGEITDRSTRWSIQFGKKQIKLHIDSGNSGSGCGKIYQTHHLTLPGGFRLPISVVKETVLTYEQVSVPTEQQPTKISKLADRYIFENMIAGKVINADTAIVSEGDITRFTGVYTCEELIGILKDEEIR